MERNVDDLMKDCQTLLASNPSCNGWLRMPSKSHNIGNIIGNKCNALATYTTNFTNKFCWNHKFVILHDKYLFVFKEATSKITEKIIRLTEYKKVKECHVESASVPWPFKLLKRDGGFQLFSAASKEDRTKWISSLLDGMKDTDAVDESGDEEAYNVIETDDESDDDGLKYHDDVDSDDSCNYEKPEDMSERKNLPLPPIPKTHLKIPTPKIPEKVPPPVSSIRSPSIQPRTPVPNIPISKFPKNKPVSPLNNYPSKKKPPNKIPPKTPTKPLPEVKRASNSRISTQSTPAEIYEGELAYEDTTRKCQTLSELCMWKGDSDGAYEVMTKLLNKTGTYLIRKATTGTGYTLAVIDGDVIRKFSILKQNNMYSLLKSEFSDLESLLKHFSNNCIPNRTLKLDTPYSIS